MSVPILISGEAAPERPVLKSRHEARLPGETSSCEVPAGMIARVRHTGGEGHFWVTMEGRRDDWVLSPGQTLGIPGPGLLVVEAVAAPASFRLS